MNSARRLLNSRKLPHKMLRGSLALLLTAAWILAPVVPVLHMPSAPEEGVRLGFEIQKANAAYGNGTDYRRSITIQESQVAGSQDLSSFPVLISFTEPEFRHTGSGGNVTNTSGYDIVFASDNDGASQLSHEIERYNSSTGEVTMWVEVPTLDYDNNTTIYMFYGEESVASSQEDVAGTWDSNYVGVWHMDDSGSTNSDSAGTANDGTVSGATAGAAGKFGPAYSFDGVNDVSTVTDHADLDITNTGTIEAWMKTDDINGSEYNFSSWVSRNAPTGSGADDQSGFDSVILGEVIYFGAFLCNDGTGDFGVASSSLSGNRFDNWDMSKMSVPSGCPNTSTAGQEGGIVGVDSNGDHIYFAALAVNNATEAFQTATATPTFSAVSTWRNDADPNGTGAAEGNGVDMVIVNGTAYYAAALLTGTTETIATTSRAIGSGATIVWKQAGVNLVGAGNENCAISIDSDGVQLYYSAFCSDGGAPEESYWSASSTIGTTNGLTWRNEADPNGAGTADFHNIDLAAMGGRLYHIAALHSDGTETVSTASSSMANGGALSWVSRQDGSSNPNGAAATDSMDASVASDGKNMYYAVFTHTTTTGSFYTASSSLPAHPFISKFGAYEAIQVGTGYAFDWAGRPYTFGTTTNTTSFRHVAITQDGSTLKMYEDGVLKRSQQTTVDFASNANNLLIGGGTRSDGTALYFDGNIDEVRVSNDDRNADWILTQYNNQNATSTFYTLGDEEASGGTVTPTVTTNFANAGFNSATLYGTKTGGDDAIEHGFAYGTNAALSGGDTATTTLGALTSNSSFSSGVGGLSAGASYYFRAYASRAVDDTGYGAIKSFTTGNSTATRKMRLFEGFTVKFLNGTVILHQQNE